MKNIEHISDYRNKRISKDLDKQMMKHLELLCVNAELVQITGSTSQKLQLIESLRKVNNLYLVDDWWNATSSIWWSLESLVILHLVFKLSVIVKMLPVRFAFVKGNTYITQRKNIKNLSKLSFNSDNISFLIKQSVWKGR